jgi:23S rRNA pseudouridine1911/1915/1917 synthase
MAHIGHPLLGDPVYGVGFKASARRLGLPAQAALQRLQRQALHAAELGFEHPITGKRLEFTSALPPDMAELLSALADPN